MVGGMVTEVTSLSAGGVKDRIPVPMLELDFLAASMEINPEGDDPAIGSQGVPWTLTP
jgi:hypothetical protein